jgi:hypothetical protein
LEHVTPCDLDLSEFYKDHFGTEPITKAPQSYCHAFRKIFISKEEYEQEHTFPDSYYVNDLKRGTYFRMEPCYIFADHSTYCADICNHFKDLEVRKTAPKELERKVECSCGTRTDDFEIHEKTYEILGGSCCLLSSLSEEDVKENLRRYGFTEKGDEQLTLF